MSSQQERGTGALRNVPGMMVALNQGQPHRVQSRAEQERFALVMVSLIEGMLTSTPGYSVPVPLGLR